jgi:tetratricopeptide (TPR) repeat protein
MVSAESIIHTSNEERRVTEGDQDTQRPKINLSPVEILNAAQKAVPAVKFALGAAGVAAAAAIIGFFVGFNQYSFIVIGATFIFMILLFIFNKLISSKSPYIMPAGIALLYVTISFFCVFLVFTITAFAIEWPLPWARFLGVTIRPYVSEPKQQGNLEPFTEGTFGILVLPFEGSTTEEQEKGVKIQGTITKILSARLRELHIDDAEVRAAPVFMAPPPHTHSAARRFGDTYHAELAIWGDITLAGVIPNLTIVHPLPQPILQSETTIMKDTLTHAQLTNIQDIRLPALTDEPTLFVAFVTGLKYYQAGQYDRAIKYFTSSLPGSSTRYIDNIPIFLFRGNAFLLAEKYEDAVADYTTAINLNPKFAEAYLNRSTVYSLQGDHVRAIADYTTALDLNPQDADAYNNQGNIYSLQGDHVRAITSFTTAINLDSENAVAYNNRGNAYSAQRNYAEAIADYTTAINLKPKFSEAYLNKASTYERMGDITGVPEAYRGFIQYAPPQEVLKIDLVKQKIKELEQHEHVKIPSQPSRQ